jgi:hypothetical protein
MRSTTITPHPFSTGHNTWPDASRRSTPRRVPRSTAGCGQRYGARSGRWLHGTPCSSCWRHTSTSRPELLRRSRRARGRGCRGRRGAPSA